MIGKTSVCLPSELLADCINPLELSKLSLRALKL